MDNQAQLQQTGDYEPQHRSFLAWLRARRGEALYAAAEPPAQWMKALVQMIIGVGTVIALVVLIWFPHIRNGGVAEFALRIVAVGLALAAVVELTYTLFTDGPDEALDPLILGLSSFLLLKISNPKTGLTLSNAGTIILFIIALGALFAVREFFIDRPKRSREKMSQSQQEQDT
jgi:hypothetical protein